MLFYGASGQRTIPLLPPPPPSHVGETPSNSFTGMKIQLTQKALGGGHADPLVKTKEHPGKSC